MYRGLVIRDEEDRWKVELREIVEPTEVAYCQLSPWWKSNLWHKW
jgi:hypothetical protein